MTNKDDNDYIDYDIHSKYCTYCCDEPPDKIAFNGKCIIYIKADGFFATNAYTSSVLDNPTYLDIFNLLHTFFEGIHYVKSINEQLAELTKSVAKVTEEVTTVKSNVEEFGKRVDAVEDDTAIRKSGDLGGVVQGNKIKKGSMWGGRFLNTADLYR